MLEIQYLTTEPMFNEKLDDKGQGGEADKLSDLLLRHGKHGHVFDDVVAVAAVKGVVDIDADGQRAVLLGMTDSVHDARPVGVGLDDFDHRSAGIGHAFEFIH